MDSDLIEDENIEFDEINQENTRRIVELLSCFDAQFDFYLDQKMDDNICRDIIVFIDDYDDFVTEYTRYVGDLRINTLLSLKLDGLRIKLNDLRDRLTLYYNSVDITMVNTVIPTRITPTRNTQQTDPKTEIIEINYDSLTKISNSVDKYLEHFTLDLDTVQLIHNFLDFYNCSSWDHELYTDLLRVKVKVKKLTKLMISIAPQAKDYVQAENFLITLSKHIEYCVDKRLDIDIVGNLGNCFRAIITLVDKWYINAFDIKQVARNLERVISENSTLNFKYNVEQAKTIESFSKDIQFKIDNFIVTDVKLLEFIASYFDFCRDVTCGYVLHKLLMVNEIMQTLINLILTDVEKDVVGKEDANVTVIMLVSHIGDCVGKNIPRNMINYLGIFFEVIQNLSKRWGIIFDEMSTKHNLQCIRNEYVIDESKKYGKVFDDVATKHNIQHNQDESMRRIKWFIGKLNAVINGEPCDHRVLCNNYFEFIDALPNDDFDNLIGLRNIAVKLINKILGI